jgi:hypothetical protein
MRFGVGGEFPHEWGTTNFPGLAGDEWFDQEGGRKSAFSNLAGADSDP